MKSQLRRIRNLALSKQGSKDKHSVQHDELRSFDVYKCTKGLENMRSGYEGFLTNGQIISGAAYDFSRSLNDMASFMMETFSEIVDDKIGDIFSMLAKVQFEVSKLLDQFATQVSQIIIIPSERVIAEIQKIEDVREKYADSRCVLYFPFCYHIYMHLCLLVQQSYYGLTVGFMVILYFLFFKIDQSFNYLVSSEDTDYVELRRICDGFGMENHEEKVKGVKGNYSNEDFLLAKEAMKQQADTIVDSMQSLVQEQSKNLLTQAARYHMAQMHFFNKSLESINAVEPMMKQLAEEANINRTVTASPCDRTDSENDKSLYRSNSGNRIGCSPTQEISSTFSEPKFIPTKPDVYSKSAPIFSSVSNRKDGGLNVIRKNEERVSMYALPTPSEAKGLNGITSESPSHEPTLKDHSENCEIYVPDHDTNILEGQKHNLYPSMVNKDASNDFMNRKTNEVQDDCDVDMQPTSTGGRYSHSGPLKCSPSAYENNHIRSHRQGATTVSGDYIFPLYKSGPINASNTPHIKYKSHPTYTLDTSSLEICELHKLPLPPPCPIAQVQPSGIILQSTPLRAEAQQKPSVSGFASPLPPPPSSRIMTRSLSTSSANHSWECNRYES